MIMHPALLIEILFTKKVLYQAILVPKFELSQI